jgi:alpha-L-fucosidase
MIKHLKVLFLVLFGLKCGALVKAADVRALPNQRISQAEEKGLQEKYSGYQRVDADYVHAGEAALDRWMDWKWGLRIHWGLYTLYAGDKPWSGESWIVPKFHLDDKEWQKKYYTSYQDFNPTGFNADEWMKIMQRGGMKYFSFTTKHHEGFCLWPTKTLQKGFRRLADGSYEDVTNHFSIAETPFKRDIVGELVRAGRAHGLGVSLYYSHIDWHDWDFAWDPRNFWYDTNFTKASDPQRWAAFMQKESDQVTELLTWYGPIDSMCFDISWGEAKEKAFGIAKLSRQLQPNTLLRNRGTEMYGDYSTPEGEIPTDPNEMKMPWQVIYPCGTGASYRINDHYKSKEWVLESLIDIVAKGGNFQVGFGPDANGQWPQEMIERVKYVGDWLTVNGECIYATRPYLRYHEGVDLRFTRSKDKKSVYIISLVWPGATLKSRMVRPKPGSVIRMLGVDQDLAWHQQGELLVIDLPKELQSESRHPAPQAFAFKVESDTWDKFANSLPVESPLPSKDKKKK